MKVYVNIDYKGYPVGETMLFTDEEDLMGFIKFEMEWGRTVTIRPERPSSEGKEQHHD